MIQYNYNIINIMTNTIVLWRMSVSMTLMVVMDHWLMLSVCQWCAIGVICHP